MHEPEFGGIHVIQHEDHQQAEKERMGRRYAGRRKHSEWSYSSVVPEPQATLPQSQGEREWNGAFRPFKEVKEEERDQYWYVSY